MPHAATATRTCNASCTAAEQLCKQFSPLLAGACHPVCWSKCSASACRPGFQQIWVQGRYLCWSPDTDYGDSAFKIGEAFGRKAAAEEWARRYGWRAGLSGGGVAALGIFLLALGVAAGRLSDRFLAGDTLGVGAAIQSALPKVGGGDGGGGSGGGGSAGERLGRAAATVGAVLAAAATAAAAAAGVVVAAAVEVGGQVVEVVKARVGGGAAAGSNDMTGVCV